MKTTLTRQELLKIAKPMIVNLQVAKTIENKSQTRRVIKDKEIIDTFLKNGKELNNLAVIERLSKWKIGDIIWVREPAEVYYNLSLEYRYRADNRKGVIDIPTRFLTEDGYIIPDWIKKSSNNEQDKFIGIPNGCIKEMARIFLKITKVRVERLQDITYEDIMDEGCDVDISDCITNDGEDQEEAVIDSIYSWFINIWNSISPKGYKWDDNPYVIVYEFENIDFEEVA